MKPGEPQFKVSIVLEESEGDSSLAQIWSVELLPLNSIFEIEYDVSQLRINILNGAATKVSSILYPVLEDLGKVIREVRQERYNEL